MAHEPEERKNASETDAPTAAPATDLATSPEADAAEGHGSPKAIDAALGAARDAAGTAATVFMNGLSAVKDVREAARRHGSARARLRELRETLEADEAELAHREEVEARYEDILREQGAIVSEANEALVAEQGKVERLEEEAKALEERLAGMRRDHEQELRPYKRLADSARERHDEASRVVAEAKRAVKTAEGQLKSATDRREQGIAAANRAVDSSQARLRKVQEELKRAQEADPSSNAVTQLKNEIVTELAHVEAARSDVSATTHDAQEAVDAASTHLWTQKQSLESAQREADDARREYEEKKGEYDGLQAKAKAEEKALEEQISAARGGAEEAKAAYDEAAERHDGAQALIDEAEEIHATPEVTAELRESIEGLRAQISDQETVVEGLSEAERGLRARTRRERVAFGAVIIAVALVLVLIVALIVVR